MFLPRACAIGVLASSAAGSAWSHTITTVDSGGVGQHTSVVYGTDGLALISYYDVINGDLKVAHCNDVACTTSTKATLDSTGDIGRFTSIAIGANGLGVISYLDVTNARLKVARCNDAACGSATLTTLAGAGAAGDGTDIAVPPDGRPVIACRAGPSLRVARCTDAACSDATAVTVHPNFGAHPTITIGGDGLPLVAGNLGPNAFIAVGHCNDADCTSVTFAYIPAPDPGEGAIPPIVRGYDATLATAPDGRGAIAYAVEEFHLVFGYRYFVHFVRCQDDACTTLDAGTSFFMSSGTFALPTPGPPVAIRADGRPIVAATRYVTNQPRLLVAQCSAPSCAGGVAQEVDGPGTGEFASVAVSPAGIGLVAYHAPAGGGQLKTIYLDDAQPADLALTTFIAAPNPVPPTVPFQINIGFQNLGPGIAFGGSVTVALPNEISFDSGFGCTPGLSHTVTCPIGDLLSGGFPFVQFRASIAPGVAGPFTVSAMATTVSLDPNLSNNSASLIVNTIPGLRVTSVQVVEGDVGLTEGRFDVELVDDGSHPSSVTASYATGGGFATSGIDYLPVSGALTFTPASPTQTVTVAIVGDQFAEMVENFFLQLTPQGAVALPGAQGLLILDDDPRQPVQGGLAHGMTVLGDLAGTGPQGPEDAYVLQAQPLSSVEVVVDSISADVKPLELRLWDWMGTLLESGTASTLGGSVRFSYFTNETVPILNNVVTIRSGGCTTCGPDDVYRVRAYDTTARIPRFNNLGDQVTVLILQNTSDLAGNGRVHFWNAQGQEVGIADFSLGPRGTDVINTAPHASGSGSITIRHDLPYGALQGKAVALEPSTGFSFDSPLEYRPR
jgi:Calx-beta domain/Domain of unknown function DUF11